MMLEFVGVSRGADVSGRLCQNGGASGVAGYPILMFMLVKSLEC